MDIRQSSRGFTLIELLVAMAVFSFIGVLGYQGWANIQKVRVGVEAQAQRLDQLQRTWHWMAEDFEQALNRSVRDQLGSARDAFQVSNNDEVKVEFSRGGWSNPAAGIAPGRSSLQRVAYGLSEARLYRYYWYHLDGIDNEQRRKRLLVDQVERLSFRYMDFEGKWHEDWPLAQQNPEPVPRAVEVTLELTDLGELVRRFALP